MDDFFNAILWFFKQLSGILSMSLLWAIPIMIIWDWVMPPLFDLPEMSFFKAAGLKSLVSILTFNRERQEY